MRLITTPSLFYWTEVLTGLAPERVTRARDEIAAWKLPRVSDEFLADTVDASVGATLLVEAMDHLEAHGVARERVRKKLRQEPAVWSTWAEIRAADITLRSAEPGVRLQLEEGRSRGAHADFRIAFPHDGGATSVEVKAVGLSDDEVAFCQRMTPSLPRFLPRIGLGHIHGSIEAAPPQLSRDERRHAQREARLRTRLVPRFPRGLRGVSIVGHGTEEQYAKRVSRRVEQAVRQLPPDDDCWVAILWSNGAPIADVTRAIRWRELPARVQGVMLLGSCVAFPDRRIHNYFLQVPRGADHNTRAEVQTLDEIEGMDRLASIVLRNFERSSGVRATLVQGGGREILRRDGSRRIHPFNFMLAPDPEGASRTTRQWWAGA